MCNKVFPRCTSAVNHVYIISEVLPLWTAMGIVTCKKYCLCQSACRTDIQMATAALVAARVGKNSQTYVAQLTTYKELLCQSNFVSQLQMTKAALYVAVA